MYQHQTAVCIRRNLFKKILVCILFPKEKGHTRISQNFSCKLNLRDAVYFTETECHDIKVTHKKEIQRVGHQQSILNWSWKSAPLPDFRSGEREEMGQAKSFCELQIKTKTLQKKSYSTIMADPFPQLWKTVLVLFISSMATSSIVLAEEENHCKWHGTAWSFS